MADVFSQQERSRIMARVRNRNTKPEMVVRKALRALGCGYHIHGKDLPGSPDIFFPGKRKAIFVHGCFWHGHDCPRGKLPSTNSEFWEAKVAANRSRDERVLERLVELGYSVLVVWSCQVKAQQDLCGTLYAFLEDSMARRSKKGDPEEVRKRLVDLLDRFEQHLLSSDLRTQVRELVPAHHHLRDLGSSLIQEDGTDSGRDRILAYLRKYVGQVIAGEELMVVAGIDDYPRRIRELRVQLGWAILSGVTLADMKKSGEDEFGGLPSMRTNDYILLHDRQDRDAAFRWNLANQIRRKKLSIKEKVLEYLLANVGKEVTGEELRYVSNDKSEWARRVRELRTEEGWRITTKTTGRPTLPVGTYILESAEQAPKQDRTIADPVRYTVMHRDDYSCMDCGWDSRKDWSASAPRHLELHHKIPHVKGGKNTEDNLITLCNICHDDRHRRGEQ